MTNSPSTPANPAQGVSEAMVEAACDAAYRVLNAREGVIFTGIEKRPVPPAIQEWMRAALTAAIGAPTVSPGWPDPLESPQAEAIRNGKLDDTEIRNLFDCMERELRLHRERAANPAQVISAQDPMTILAGIKQFGLAPDGSDLRDLEAAIARLSANPAQVTDASLEPVARAICSASGFDPDDCYYGSGSTGAGTSGFVCYTRQWERYKPHAQSAIAAIGAGVATGPISETAPVLPTWGGQAAAVKALEWRTTAGQDCIANAMFGGLYSIQFYAGMKHPAKLETRGWYDGLSGMFESLDAAKSAAQADYERRILSALFNPPAQPGWRLIETAPKDGTKIQVWADGYEWPEVIYYERYDDATAVEAGAPGYWRYADNLFADVAEVEEAELTSWMPIPAAPQPKGE